MPKFKGFRFVVHFEGVNCALFLMRKSQSGIRYATPQEQYAGHFSYETAVKLSQEFAGKMPGKTIWMRRA